MQRDINKNALNGKGTKIEITIPSSAALDNLGMHLPSGTCGDG